MNNFSCLIESTIDGVRVDVLRKEVIVDIAYAAIEEGRAQIVAVNVDDFSMSEMRLSNVIDRVFIVDSSNYGECSIDLERRLFFLMRGRNSAPSELEWSVLKEKSGRVRDGSLIFMEIEPAYGAIVFILAAEFKLECIGRDSSFTSDILNK